MLEALPRCFGDYLSEERRAEWEAVKRKLRRGEAVEGCVVARAPFGVFVDIGFGFPALLEVICFRHAKSQPYADINQYPAVGCTLEACLSGGFSDSNRQIGLT